MNIHASLSLDAKWIVSWIVKIPSKIDLPGTNPVCSSEISLGKKPFSLLARILAKILYIVFHKAIGRKSPGCSGPSFLGIRVIKEQLILASKDPPFLDASIAFQRSSLKMSQHF